MGISLVGPGGGAVQTEFFLPFDLNDLRVMDDDFNGPKPDVLKGMPKKFVGVMLGFSIEFHGAKSGAFLKYLNPIKIEYLLNTVNGVTLSTIYFLNR